MITTTPLSIKILANNYDLKGKSFEEFMYLILDKLGYTSLMTRVHTTGMEFDIMAKHRESSQSILCECKAHEKEMDTGELLKFYGKLCHERSKNKSLKGMFFSISGFNGTALKNYSELNEEDKLLFEIYGNNEIVELLKRSSIFAPDEEIEKSISLHTNGYPVGDRYLVYYESNIYLVQLIKIAGVSRNYIILTANGEIVQKSVRERISALDSQLTSLEQLDLEIIDEVLLKLLDNKEKTIETVSKEMNMKYEDVKVALEELRLENIVNTINADSNETSFKIISNMDNLGKVIKKFEGNHERRYKFMASVYANSLIGSKQFIEFIENRFYISINERQRNNLIILASVFPSVISMIIFRFNNDFKNTYEQRELSSIPEGKKNGFRDMQLRIFMGEILSRTYHDMLEIQNEYLDSRGVRGFIIENGVKLATDSGLVIDLANSQAFYLGRAAGVIKPGQLVAGGIDTVWKMAVTLMDLRKYDDAIEYFEKVINLSGSKNDYLIGAWNNKGLCYLRMEKYEEAVPCFKEVISLDGTHYIASQNMGLCLKKLKTKLSELKLMQQQIERQLGDESSSNPLV